MWHLLWGPGRWQQFHQLSSPYDLEERTLHTWLFVTLTTQGCMSNDGLLRAPLDQASTMQLFSS